MLQLENEDDAALVIRAALAEIDRLREENERRSKTKPPPGCDLCGDADGALFLHARCHPTAPLRAQKEGDVLVLRCYVPDCGREVVRLKLAWVDVTEAR